MLKCIWLFLAGVNLGAGLYYGAAGWSVAALFCWLIERQDAAEDRELQEDLARLED